MEFQLIQSRSTRQWRVRLVSANGRILVWSEPYHNKADAEHVIELVKSTNILTPVREYEED